MCLPSGPVPDMSQALGRLASRKAGNRVLPASMPVWAIPTSKRS